MLNSLTVLHKFSNENEIWVLLFDQSLLHKYSIIE